MPYSPQAILAIYDPVDKHLPSMEKSGVLAAKSGYHNSYNANKKRWPGNYSITEPLDQLGDRDAASGWDAKFNRADMRTATTRLMNASLAGDPRLHCVREWFGSYDGNVVTGYSIYRKRKATSDASHKWHIHVSGWRKYANDAKAWLGVAEIICGLPAGSLTGEVVYLPTMFVDPKKVSTFLFGLDDTGQGRTAKERGPGFALATLTHTKVVGGDTWYVTEAGYRYHGDYLTTVEPEPKPNDPPDEEEPDEEPPPIPPTVYLPVHWVDPKKVSTFLYGVRVSDGEPVKERRPRYKIDTGIRVDEVDGKEWLVTEAGYRYAVDFLTTTDPGPEPPPRHTVKVGTCNIYVGNSIANGKKAVKAFADAGADAVGWQELSQDADQKALTAYAKTLGWDATDRNSAVTTFYNTKTQKLIKESFEVVEKGGRKWEAGAGGNDSIYKIIMSTEFEDKATGKRWFLHNNHINPTIEHDGHWRDNPIRVAIAKRQFVRLAENLKDSGSRLSVATGDMNVGWGDGPVSDWCERTFDAVGATVCWDEAGDQPTHGDRTIDWVIARNGRFVNTEVVNIPGSDHEGVLCTIEF